MGFSRYFLLYALMLTVLTIVPVLADSANSEPPPNGMNHGAMNHDMPSPTISSPGPTLDNPYGKAMMDMHARMNEVKPSGDVDVDFVAGMIPHHQGAIDMAKVELENGSDPEIKKLAEDIIAAQEKEIALMKEWLKKHQK